MGLSAWRERGGIYHWTPTLALKVEHLNSVFFRGTGEWGVGGAAATSDTFTEVPQYRGCCRTTTISLPRERRRKSTGERTGETSVGIWRSKSAVVI